MKYYNTQNAALLLILTCGMLIPTTLLAHPPVRCRGMIQFRPCLANKKTYPKRKSVSSLKITSRTASRASYRDLSGSGKQIEVKSPTFKRLSPAIGQWSGRIEGTGKVHLTLLFYRNGRLSSRKYMGNVRLDRDENISFRFSSALPSYATSRDWSWQVVAHA